MSKVLMIFVAVGLVCFARPLSTQLTHQDIKAEDFIIYITVANPYPEWQTWPEKAKFHETRSPEAHGALVTTYINRTALESVFAKKGMADASIIVVENYTADRKLARLTAMYKVAGYDPEFGDWFWVETTGAGRVIAYGSIQACINCHGAQATNDYIWTGEVGRAR